jgi:type IV secretion system protein VirD4
MAGYGIKSFLIAQSLNQIEKAYGPNNSILDNCHVRIAFSSNDERTAKRISDALGTATELRAQRNYAGHRLSPWLAHVMVSRQETARPLLTPGEVMQLPPSDELVLISGLPPIRAKKLRYYQDDNFISRVSAAPVLKAGPYEDKPALSPDDWSGQVRGVHAELLLAAEAADATGTSDEGPLQQQQAPEHSNDSVSNPVADQPHDAARDHNEESDVSLDDIRRAHAMNESDPHPSVDNDLIPSF